MLFNQEVDLLPTDSIQKSISLTEDGLFVIDHFANKVKHHPEKIAVVFEDVCYTYRFLDSESDLVALELQHLNIPCNTMVGLYVQRSHSMLVAMLGILKVGCAYVPLDPSYPKQRLETIIEDAGLSYLIYDQPLPFDNAPEHCINLVDIKKRPDQQIAPVKVEVNAPDLAYVIYTSGSTGKPKGVKIHHGAMMNFLESMSQVPGFNENDVILAVTTISFDISVLELFLPLICGGKIVLASQADVIDGERLKNLLMQDEITVMQATPATWRMLFIADWKGKANLKALCGGEALDNILCGKLFTATHSLWNMYGPTETTVWSTCHHITNPNGPILVGKPIQNTSLHVLDEVMRAVPIGEVGELYIGGDGLSFGYVDNLLSKERFLIDPNNTARIYKTGDLARISPEGLLEILGRADNQVKMKGYRIELGEIESCINQIKGIEQSIVVAQSDASNEKKLIAFIVLNKKDKVLEAAINDHLVANIPSYMHPARIIFINTLPMTPNGKIDRIALQDLELDNPIQLLPSDFNGKSNTEILVNIVCSILSISDLDRNANFFELGLDSLQANHIVALFNRHTSSKASVADLFLYPTINGFIDTHNKSHLVSDIYTRVMKHNAQRNRESTDNSVAIIGMAGRFPGADTIDEFWQLLAEGRDTITRFTEAEDDPIIEKEIVSNPNYRRTRGMIKQPDLFDASFFGISPNDAVVMDPQQRIFLEVAWTALEHAAYDSNQYDGLVAVYAGMGNNFYYHYNVSTNPNLIKMVGEVQTEIGREKDHIATLVSNKLNLTGPSVSVHTACSTALVAIDNACQSLLSYQCDMALAGGIEVRTPQMSGQIYEPLGIFTGDGYCRPFSDNASGTMFSDGAGVIVLKRLKDAILDNDTIHAVLLGTAVNHDGSNKKSYLAPSVKGQMDVIALAQARAGVKAESISYIEAHGTATPVGDPIEFDALKGIFEHQTSRKNFCALGSVKGNIGHPTTAAGVVSVIKTALSLKNAQIPALVNFNQINPNIDIDNSPFYIPTKLQNWKQGATGRRAGVSSFGFCGTNAHVVMEEYIQPKAIDRKQGRSTQPLFLSAATKTALDTIANTLSTYTVGNPSVHINDIAYTLSKGRKRQKQRGFVICTRTNDGSRTVSDLIVSSSAEKKIQQKPRKLAFVFPGQGAQYSNMGKGLYFNESVFKDNLDHCASLLHDHLGEDIRDLLIFNDSPESAAALLKNTYYTQPAIFCLEYSLAKLWQSWGIQPELLVGHSIGEFVCATLAGVFSLEDGIKLIAARGRLVRDLPGGGMLSVRMPSKELAEIIDDRFSIAAVNSPHLCVVSGENEEIDKLKTNLDAKGVPCSRLHTSHAFHSWMMEPIVEAFFTVVDSIKLNTPAIPIISTVTGQHLTAKEAQDPSYWANHLRATVQFSQAIATLFNEEELVLLEVGPRGTMSTLARVQADPARHAVISSLTDTSENNAECTALARATGMLWVNHIEVKINSYLGLEQPKRIPLPTYPFERKRYWIDPIHQRKSQPEIAQATSPVIDANLSKVNKVPQADNVRDALKQMLQEISGLDLKDTTDTMTFFEMGLDSLLLTPVTFKVNEMYKIKITFQQLLTDLSSLSSLTAYIQKYQIEKQAPGISAPNIEKTPGVLLSSELPIINPQQWILSQRPSAENFISSHVTSVTLFLYGLLDTNIIEQSLEKMLERHELLKSNLSADKRALVISQPKKLALTKITLDAPKETDFARFISEEINNPFDLTSGSLFRATIIQSKNNEHRVILSASNLICDVWSMDVLIEELTKLYNQGVTGTAINLPTVNTFQQYATSLPSMINYWQQKNRLNDRHVAMIAAREIKTLSIQGELMTTLRHFSVQNGCSTFVSMLLFVVESLKQCASYLGETVIISMAGQAVNNQPHFVGQCTNLVPIFNCKRGEEDMGQFAKKLQDKVVEAYENQNGAYSVMLEEGKALVPNSAIHVIHTKRLRKENYSFVGLESDYRFNPITTQFADIEFNLIEFDEKIIVEIGYKTGIVVDDLIVNLKTAIQNLIRGEQNASFIYRFA